MTEAKDFRIGEPVRHVTKFLSEPTFFGWSKSGMRIGVKHNSLWPFGVGYSVDYFDPKNIERVKFND